MHLPCIRQMELLAFLDMERLIPDTHIRRLGEGWRRGEDSGTGCGPMRARRTR